MPSDCLVPELYCVNFERSYAFYTQELGFNVLYQRPEDRFAYFERQGSRIMIEELGASREWLPAEPEYPFGRGVNFQIGTTNINELHTSLQKNGHKFFLPLEDKWYRKNQTYVGNRQFIIQDPDGYLLRFAQDLGTITAQEFEHKASTQ